MKHCQRAKLGGPTIRLVKHDERGNFPSTLYRIANNLLQRGHGEDLVYSRYYGARKGNPMMGGFTQVMWGAYFNIKGEDAQQGDSPLTGGNQLLTNQLNWPS